MMVDRILVPLDGSMTAEAVLPQVRRLLKRNDSELILVRAVVPPPVENAALMIEAVQIAAEEYIAGLKQKLEAAGVRVKTQVRLGGPSTVILKVAAELKATMIALATHGSTGLKRLLLGSVAEELIRLSPLPILAVRPFYSYELSTKGGAEFEPLRNILLPVDEAALGALAIEPVAKLAELFESRVVLLKVLQPKGRKPVTEAATEAARKELTALSKRIEKRGVETGVVVGQGDAIEEILKSVRFHEIDLIAMPTHGRRGLKRLLLGSVTEQVLREARVPMLILRPAKPAAR